MHSALVLAYLVNISFIFVIVYMYSCSTIDNCEAPPNQLVVSHPPELKIDVGGGGGGGGVVIVVKMCNF